MKIIFLDFVWKDCPIVKIKLLATDFCFPKFYFILFYFLKEFLTCGALYHQTKTSVSFLYRQGLNPRSLLLFLFGKLVSQIYVCVCVFCLYLPCPLSYWNIQVEVKRALSREQQTSSRVEDFNVGKISREGRKL